MRRGSAIDKQVTRLVNRKEGGESGGRGEEVHPFATMIGQALTMRKLQPVLAQRGVACLDGGVASAADLLALDREGRMVVVEVKCGFVGNRDAPVEGACSSRSARPRFAPPLSSVSDCARSRHLAQLAATHAMLAEEEGQQDELPLKGLRGVLLYVDAEGVETVELSSGWIARGKRLLAHLRADGV